MKYIKKPVIVEAFRLHVDNEIPEWFIEKLEEHKIILLDDGNCLINTLEGVIRSQKGDYIVKDFNGEVYSCESDLFEKTHEKISGNNI